MSSESTPIPGSVVDMSRIVPLVTGGGSGIGLGLVREFLKRGAPKVIITGRRENVLREAAEAAGIDGHPGKIAYRVSDAGNAQDREELLEWVQSNHPDCNALVNNAGIQRRIPLAEDTAPWTERTSEIEINLNGPIHLCTLFTPFFLQKQQANSNEIFFICNVTSGLAFVPFPAGPVYAATKAAMHSYTVSLRYSLEPTNVKVVEIVPPAVKTNLGGSHDFGEELDEFCAHAMDQFERGSVEFGYKFSELARKADRETVHRLTVDLSNHMHVKQYEGGNN